MNFFKSIHPRNWSKYSRGLSLDRQPLHRYKRIILVSQFTLFGFFVGIIHAIEDLVDGLLFMPMMDLIMASGVLVCYFVNEAGWHKLSKILLVAFLNIFFFVYASLAPRDLGIYLYYFPWVGLAAVIFESNENSARLFFIGLSAALLVVLFASEFRLFGSHTFQAIDLERSFIINLVSSLLVLVFFIILMANMNEHSENRLLELAEEIRINNAGLEKANRELDRFFYSTTHDLKVPLMDIRGIVNNAVTEIDDPKVLDYFILLGERVQRLDGFLQDVIDYARNAQTGVGTELVNVDKVVDDVIENFKFAKGADRIHFQKNIHVNTQLLADRVRIMIILNNVISNAIKYHRHDIKDPWVRIDLSHAENKLKISVSDNGQGIDEELLPKIFDMFFRGTNQSKGSGLGLYIVKETVEKLNGTIQVISRPGEGSTFSIILPALGDPHRSSVVETPDPFKAQLASGRNTV